MKVLTHLDPHVLERELLEQVERVRRADCPSRVLVLVPTRRLADHVQRRLCRAASAWLGVEVLHFRALAGRLLARPGSRPGRLLSMRLQRAVLQQLLARLPGNPWGRFVVRRPGGSRGLLRSLRDLREAGLTVAEVEAAADSGAEKSLAEVYAAFVSALKRLEKRGWVDDAGRVEAALPQAGRWASRYDAILLHGTYELIGIHLELLRALDRQGRVTVLLPAQPGRPVSAHAERWARRYLLGEGEDFEPLEADSGDSRRERLSALYDERASPSPAEPEAFACCSTQGAAAEARVALRRALRAVGNGCPPEEIVIAARSLAPYAAVLEEAFADDGLPWESSLSYPLRRQPLVRDFLTALQVVAEDFPRRKTAELLGSPRIRWSRLTGDERRLRGDRADAWSRKARLLGGLREWSEELPDWVERSTSSAGGRPEGPAAEEERRERAAWRKGEALRLGQALEALVHRLEPDRARSWDEHARTLDGLLHSLFEPEAGSAEARGLEALEEIVAELPALGLLGGERAVPFERLRAWIEEAVRGTEPELHDARRGGIRVLDAMQLRGITCRRLFLLGMNSGLFPRAPREDPILDDALRQRLVERTGRPLVVRSTGVEEERLLLLQLLGAAEQGVEISWQRADEAGRARTPSLALREIARLVRGRPELRALLDGVKRISSHPQKQIEQLAQSSDLLSPEDVCLLAALRTSGPYSNRELAGRYPELAEGLSMLSATESFRETDTRYDARIGAVPTPPEFSPSGLELLGSCPLKFFFSRVLKVRELDEEASPFAIEAREMGLYVHALLESIYGRLREEGLFEAPLDAERLLARARLLLQHGGGEFAGALGPRIARRLPVLWEQLAAQWLGAIRAFVEHDLQAIVDGEWRPVAFEADRERQLDLGQGVALRLRGRLDRVLQGDGLLVGDYKTSRTLERYLDVKLMLRGSKLQAPLYRELFGGQARVELLGVGPHYEPGSEEARRVFDGFDNEKQQAGFVESLRVLVRLAESGVYPFHKDNHCGWCAYDQACRRVHPPSLEREKLAPDSADYRAVQEKTAMRKPTLEAVRRRGTARRAGRPGA